MHAAGTAPDHRRFRCTVQYDGRGFHGWQVQAEERTVQGEIESVVSRLFDRPMRILGAGRTDRGVHATGQVASVDAPPGWSAVKLRRAMNALLPEGIWIAECVEAKADFHPRYDALARSYRYDVGTAHEARSPFHRPWCWPVRTTPDIDRMAEVTEMIVGSHSFLAFAKAGQEERGDRCVVAEARWEPWEGLGLHLHITADRFLHHMVRYLVGTLVAIGTGEREPGDMKRLLEGDGELLTSPPAPPEGLFLTRVRYPDDPAAPAATPRS